MKIFAIVFYIFIFISSQFLQAAKIDNKYSYIASFPNDKEIVNSIIVVSNNFIAQVGYSYSYDYPMVEVLTSNNEFFTKWELPIERKYYNNDAVLLAGTSYSNQICLLLNNRLDFFTVDGEYIQSVELTPEFPIYELQNVVDIAYEPVSSHFFFLSKAEKAELFEYSSRGNLLNSYVLQDYISTNQSLFLTISENKLLIGGFNENSIYLYDKNGLPINSSDEDENDDNILSIIDDIITTLSEIYSTNIPQIIDIAQCGDTIWAQTSEYLINFDTDGKILNIPLTGFSNQSPDKNIAYSATLPDRRILWSAFKDRFFTIDGFGKNPRVYFWSQILDEKYDVLDFCLDNQTNWWLICRKKESPFEINVIKITPDKKIETVLFDIIDQPPFAFIKTLSGPIGVMGNSYYTPIIEAGKSITYWQHNLQINSNETICGVATTNGLIFISVRNSTIDKVWSFSRDEIFVFDSLGNLIKTIDFDAGFIFPQSKTSVLALNKNGDIIKIDSDNMSFYQIANINLEGSENICGFNCLFTNLYVFPSSLQKAMYYTANYKYDAAVLVKPRNKEVIFWADKEEKSLYIIGPAWKNKLLHQNPLGRLLKLGKKLSKNPVKIYKKLSKIKNKNKSYINKITIDFNKLNYKIDNLYIYTSAKQIKLLNASLNNISAEYGNEVIPLGKLNIFGDCHAYISCSQIKKLTVNKSFTGKLKTWFNNISYIYIGGDCNNAVIYSRKNINKMQVNKSIINTIIRAGISPRGFTGYSGNINSINVFDNIEASEIIACANEGNSNGWSGKEKYDNEQFYGSIFNISGRILRRGRRITFLSNAINSLFVSREPIKNLRIQFDDSNKIINGNLK